MRVKSNFEQLAARTYIEQLASKGRFSFDSQEARRALNVSANAVKLALNRLSKQGLLAQPARGFYVIIPPEYRSLGCLPADQFIPDLMKAQDRWYYAGLLTAAQYYGAAHQRPQAFQVLLEQVRRPIECGQVRITFIARKRIREVPVRIFNTPRGQLKVSSPEATALDLAGYPQHVGGLDGVATILAELAESIDADSLASVAATAPLSWAQRLGYLMDLSEAGEKAGPLRSYVRESVHEHTLLLPGGSLQRARAGHYERVRDWKIIVNAEIEPDL